MKSLNRLSNASSCEFCGSMETTVAPEGFIVCTVCGSEQSAMNMQRKIMFDENGNINNQRVHTNLYRKKIGSSFERMAIGGGKFNTLARIEKRYVKQYKDNVLRKAYGEIKRICSTLQLTIAAPSVAFKAFKKIWPQLSSGSKGRSFLILSPAIVYKTAQSSGQSVTFREVMKVAQCDRIDLFEVLKTINPMLPNYDRMRPVISEIYKVCDDLDMEVEIKERAVSIIKNNRQILLSTIKSVAAGTAVSMAVISLKLRRTYRPYHIAKSVGCSTSAISSRTKKVLKSRGIIERYTIKQLDTVLPQIYVKLVE